LEAVMEGFATLKTFSAPAKAMIAEIYTVDLNAKITPESALELTDILFQKDINDADGDGVQQFWYFNGYFDNPAFNRLPLLEKVLESFATLKGFSDKAKVVILEAYGVDLNQSLKVEDSIALADLLFQKDIKDADNNGIQQFWYFSGDFDKNPTFNLAPLEKFLEAAYTFRAVVVGKDLQTAFSLVFGTAADLTKFSKENLEALSFFLIDKEGKIKSEAQVEEFLTFLPYVASVFGAIKDGLIVPDAFVAWSQNRGFDIPSLPAPLTLNPSVAATYGRQNLANFADATFTLASDMQYFLGEMEQEHLNTEAFNRVYGLHSLLPDFSFDYKDFDLTSVIFMIISGVNGDFKDVNNFDTKKFAQQVPLVAGLIEAIQGRPDYAQALNSFFALNIPVSGDFDLNPTHRTDFNLTRTGQRLFNIAESIRQRTIENKAGFPDAITYLEVVYKMFENKDMIQAKLDEVGGSKINFLSENTGFSYRILNGVVTIFFYDGYVLDTKVQPDGVALLSASFLAQGLTLREVRERFSRDEDLIKASRQIAAISVRQSPLDHKDIATDHVQYVFLPEGSLLRRSEQRFDAVSGRLLAERLVSPQGYAEAKEFTYVDNDDFIFHDETQQPFFVPTRIDTFVEAGAERARQNTIINHSVDKTAETITQTATYYTPQGLETYQAKRTVDLGTGNSLEEVDEEGYVRTVNEYASAYTEFLGLSSKSTKYSIVTGEVLSESTFDADKDIVNRPEGLRLVLHLNDNVTGLVTTQEKDAFNLLHKEIRRNHVVHRAKSFSYDNTFYAGFGAATHSEDVDLITGLEITRSIFLEFNEHGGITFMVPQTVKDTARIEAFDGRGRVREVYEDAGSIGYENGHIRASVVNVYSYDDANWKAMRIASKVERFFWDEAAQESRGAAIRISNPKALVDLTTTFGTYRVLEVEETRAKIDMTMTIYINLVNGAPVRYLTPCHMIDIGFNSIDVEEASKKMNLAGAEIEETTSVLDELGRPRGRDTREVRDAEGNIMRAHLLKHLVNPNTGEEKDLIQDLGSGLVDKVLITSPDVLGPGVVWQVNIGYEKYEIEEKTQTLAYQNGVNLGEVKHTETYDAGNAKLHKREYPRLGPWLEYEQDAYSGLLDHIKVHARIQGKDRILFIKRDYSDVDVIRSWRMSLEENGNVWVLDSVMQEPGVDIANKKMNFDFVWSSGHRETAVMDVNTGLFPYYIYEIETKEGVFATLIVEAGLEPLGTEISRGVYVDKNRNNKIDEEERAFWFMKSHQTSVDKFEHTATNRYERPNGARGEMVVNTDLGIELSGTLENIDMGNGLYETFSYTITLSPDVRPVGRTTRNAEGEPVIKSHEVFFDFNTHTSKAEYLTAWGEEGVAVIDTQSSLTRGYEFNNIEIVPGIYDTRTARIDHTDTGIFDSSRTYSEALKNRFKAGLILESRSISENGLVQKVTDWTHGGEEATVIYNMAGLLLRQYGILRDSENAYTSRGILQTGTIRDRVSQELLADVTAIFNDKTKTYTIEEVWYDERGNEDYVVTKTVNRWGKVLVSYTNDILKSVPGYGIGGLEVGAKVYKKDLSGAFSNLYQEYKDFRWNKGLLNLQLNVYKQADLFERRREEYREGALLKQDRDGVVSEIDYIRGHKYGQRDYLKENHQLIGYSEKMRAEDLDAKVWDLLSVQKQDIEQTDFYKRVYLAPNGLPVKETIEGFVFEEDMPVVLVANGFVDIAKHDELGVYATERFDIELGEKVAYGIFISPQKVLILDYVKQLGLVEVRDFIRSEATDSKEYLIPYLKEKYTLSKKQPFAREDVDAFVAKLGSAQDYTQRGIIAEDYRQENFFDRAFLDLTYKNGVPFNPFYLKYVEVPAHAATFPYLLDIKGFDSHPIETSELQAIDSENITSLHKINYILPSAEEIFIRRTMDWKGRIRMAEYLDKKKQLQLRARTTYLDAIWGNYGIGARGMTSTPDKDSEQIYRVSYLKRLQPGMFEYDVIKGLFGEYAPIFEIQPLFQHQAISEVSREGDDGEGRLKYILSGYRIDRFTGRPVGAPQYIAFLNHPFTPYSMIDAGPFHMGFAEDNFIYEYDAQNDTNISKYQQPVYSFWKWLKTFRYDADSKKDSNWVAYVNHLRIIDGKLVYDVVDTRKTKQSIKEIALRLDGRLYYELHEGKILRDPTTKVYFNGMELPQESTKITSKGELPYRKLIVAFDKDRTGYMWVWERSVEKERPISEYFTDTEKIKDFDFLSGESISSDYQKGAGEESIFVVSSEKASQLGQRNGMLYFLGERLAHKRDVYNTKVYGVEEDAKYRELKGYKDFFEGLKLHIVDYKNHIGGHIFQAYTWGSILGLVLFTRFLLPALLPIFQLLVVKINQVLLWIFGVRANKLTDRGDKTKSRKTAKELEALYTATPEYQKVEKMLGPVSYIPRLVKYLAEKNASDQEIYAHRDFWKMVHDYQLNKKLGSPPSPGMREGVLPMVQGRYMADVFEINAFFRYAEEKHVDAMTQIEVGGKTLGEIITNRIWERYNEPDRELFSASIGSERYLFVQEITNEMKAYILKARTELNNERKAPKKPSQPNEKKERKKPILPIDEQYPTRSSYSPFLIFKMLRHIFSAANAGWLDIIREVIFQAAFVATASAGIAFFIASPAAAVLFASLGAIGWIGFAILAKITKPRLPEEIAKRAGASKEIKEKGMPEQMQQAARVFKISIRESFIAAILFTAMTLIFQIGEVELPLISILGFVPFVFFAIMSFWVIIPYNYASLFKSIRDQQHFDNIRKWNDVVAYHEKLKREDNEFGRIYRIFYTRFVENLKSPNDQRQRGAVISEDEYNEYKNALVPNAGLKTLPKGEEARTAFIRFMEMWTQFYFTTRNEKGEYDDSIIGRMKARLRLEHKYSGISIIHSGFGELVWVFFNDLDSIAGRQVVSKFRKLMLTNNVEWDLFVEQIFKDGGAVLTEEVKSLLSQKNLLKQKNAAEFAASELARILNMPAQDVKDKMEIWANWYLENAGKTFLSSYFSHLEMFMAWAEVIGVLETQREQWAKERLRFIGGYGLYGQVPPLTAAWERVNSLFDNVFELFNPQNPQEREAAITRYQGNLGSKPFVMGNAKISGHASKVGSWGNWVPFVDTELVYFLDIGHRMDFTSVMLTPYIMQLFEEYPRLGMVAPVYTTYYEKFTKVSRSLARGHEVWDRDIRSIKDFIDSENDFGKKYVRIAAFKAAECYMPEKNSEDTAGGNSMIRLGYDIWHTEMVDTPQSVEKVHLFGRSFVERFGATVPELFVARSWWEFLSDENVYWPVKFGTLISFSHYIRIATMVPAVTSFIIFNLFLPWSVFARFGLALAFMFMNYFANQAINSQSSVYYQRRFGALKGWWENFKDFWTHFFVYVSYEAGNYFNYILGIFGLNEFTLSPRISDLVRRSFGELWSERNVKLPAKIASVMIPFLLLMPYHPVSAGVNIMFALVVFAWLATPYLLNQRVPSKIDFWGNKAQLLQDTLNIFKAFGLAWYELLTKDLPNFIARSIIKTVYISKAIVVWPFKKAGIVNAKPMKYFGYLYTSHYARKYLGKFRELLALKKSLLNEIANTNDAVIVETLREQIVAKEGQLRIDIIGAIKGKGSYRFKILHAAANVATYLGLGASFWWLAVALGAPSMISGFVLGALALIQFVKNDVRYIFGWRKNIIPEFSAEEAANTEKRADYFGSFGFSSRTTEEWTRKLDKKLKKAERGAAGFDAQTFADGARKDIENRIYTWVSMLAFEEFLATEQERGASDQRQGVPDPQTPQQPSVNNRPPTGSSPVVSIDSHQATATRQQAVVRFVSSKQGLEKIQNFRVHSPRGSEVNVVAISSPAVSHQNVVGNTSSPITLAALKDRYTTLDSTDSYALKVLYLRDNKIYHAFTLDLNKAYSKEELAKYSLYEIYNRLSIFGAEEVIVSTDDSLYQEIEILFRTPTEVIVKEDGRENKRGYFQLGSFMNIVYELPQQAKNFSLRYATESDMGGYVATKENYAPATAQAINLEGYYLGIDIGGSDIKNVVTKDGQVIYSYKEDWQPNTFTSSQQHKAYFTHLIERALEHTTKDLSVIKGLGISFNLVVVNNRPTGMGPVVDGLKGTELEIIKDIANSLSKKLAIPVFILNDGDAAALWAAVKKNTANTLALALGTGLAGGYVDANLTVRDYLTEMGNVVLETKEGALKHSFSKVPGAAQMYLSQRLPFELAREKGIDLSGISENAAKLRHLQGLYEQGDIRAMEIFAQVGLYLAEYITYINTVIPVQNVYLFGRVLKGHSGEYLLETAQEYLQARNINIALNIPDDVEFAQAEGAAIYAAAKVSSSPITIAFGGPDGVLIEYDRFRKTTLEDSVVRSKFLELLRQGHDIVVITDQRYFDDKPQAGVFSEIGLVSRLVRPLRMQYPALLQHLTIYASAGTFKVTFNQKGEAIIDHAFNTRTAMDEKTAIEMKEAIEAIIEREYWLDYQARPEYYRNVYPTFVFEGHKPEVILHKNDGSIFGMTVLYLPSRLLGAYNEIYAEDKEDIREKVLAALKAELPEAINPYIWSENQYTANTRGIASIDIRRQNTGKDHALRQHVIDNRINPSDVFFFGNLDEHAEDKPLELVSGINRFANSHMQNENFRSLEIGLGSIYYWMDFIAKHAGKDALAILREHEIALHRYPALVAALDYTRELKAQGALKADHAERIEQLYQIYKNFNLTAVDAASWTLLYQEAFDLNKNTREALDELIRVYHNHNSTESFFKAADEIYARYGNLDFSAFYEAVDARAARNSRTIIEVYGSVEILKQTVLAAFRTSKISITRILSGYYQDNYFLRYKEVMFATLKGRAPPKAPKVVYLGGGGKATTTLLQKLIEKGLTKLACTISSSDDGGSSKNIMMSLFEKFGFYFIPAGDAAGLNIFLSDDNFKIFTLFWIESNGKNLPKDILAKAQQVVKDKYRITADTVYPVWKERFQKLLPAIVDPAQKEAIEKALTAVLETEVSIKYNPEKHLIFVTSLLSLGDLLDRELVKRGIITLDDMSTANLLLIGDAYDSGVIKTGKAVKKDIEQLLLHETLELGDAQPVAVSYDYERSALVAYDKDGKLLQKTQTLITDKALDRLIYDLYFSHRTAEKRMKKFESTSDATYPKANPKAVELLNEAELIVMGNGSLWTSLMPVLLYPEVARALLAKKEAGVPVVFIAKIKSDLETAAGVKVIDRDGKKYLVTEEQMALIEQLQAISRHISRALRLEEALSLNQIFTHVIIPGLTTETVEALSTIELSDANAFKLSKSLAEGEAQISKYIEGIQPRVTEEHTQYLKDAGLKVEVVSEDHIIGIDARKPLYNNDHLYEVLKSIAPKAFEGASSPIKINDSFKALPELTGTTKTIRVSYERPLENFRQVSDIYKVITAPSHPFGIGTKEMVAEENKLNIAALNPHIHPPVDASKAEFVMIVKGEAVYFIFDENKKLAKKVSLKAGDKIFAIFGHDLVFVKDGKMIEFSQGPWPGIGKDRIFFNVSSSPLTIVFGGPDGVLLPYGRYRTSTLKDSIVRGKFIALLEKGYPVVIITDQRYYDELSIGECGIESRIVRYIPDELRKHLTIYASGGAFKVVFDEEGRPLINDSYNEQTRIDKARIIPQYLSFFRI
ncbi:MAG: ROK family protein, partial [Candidatus Omnitrophica bacterium]|nr:ROK family protein [Candidatus Omnitrophota bacterium]